MTETQQGDVFALLADPATHDGAKVTRFDTHAASVFLAGDRAYKVKRAVRFPFLDYSTLEKRKAACTAELKVNRRFAPELYHRVVPISRDGGALRLDGAGEPVEWAVEMTRFDEAQTLDHVAGRGGLAGRLPEKLARMVAAMHRKAEPVDPAPWLAALDDYIKQNTEGFRRHKTIFPHEQIDELDRSSRAALGRLRPLLIERGRLGLIRQGHGDLHLGNIALVDDEPVAFDAIEFDPVIASGDVLYDLAFMLMDLVERDLTAAVEPAGLDLEPLDAVGSPQRDLAGPLAVVESEDDAVGRDLAQRPVRRGLGVEADHLEVGARAVGQAVVLEDDRPVRVGARPQQPPGRVHAGRLAEEVDRHRDGVHAEVHEASAAERGVEGGRQLARAEAVHARGVLLLDQEGPVRAGLAGAEPGEGLADRRGPRLEGGQPALHEEAVGAAGGGHHGLGLLGAQREGLLDENVEPGLERRDRLLSVERVGRADVDDVEGRRAVRTTGGEHLGQGGVGGADAVLGGEGRGPLRVRGGDRDDLDLRQHGGRLHEPPGDEAGPDDPEADAGLLGGCAVDGSAVGATLGLTLLLVMG